MLISEEMMEKVKAKYIVEYAGSAEVKGKAQALKMYRVNGFIDEAGTPTEVRTPYSEFESGDADKIKIA